MDYDYIKNHYRLIPVDLITQKELDADPKVIQQIEFAGKLKKFRCNGNSIDAVHDRSMFVLTILQKIKGTRIKFS